MTSNSLKFMGVWFGFELMNRAVGHLCQENAAAAAATPGKWRPRNKLIIFQTRIREYGLETVTEFENVSQWHQLCVLHGMSM